MEHLLTIVDGSRLIIWLAWAGITSGAVWYVLKSPA